MPKLSPKRRAPIASFSEKDDNGFYKAYHDVTAYMPFISGNAWKVLCYVMRNTVGFQEWEPKRITLDEFMRGRKRRDQSRLDKGTGLNEHAVIRAIKECIAADVLYVEVDAHDKGRIQKRYAVIAPDHPYYGVVVAEEGKPGVKLVGGVYFLSDFTLMQQRAFIALEEQKYDQLSAPGKPKSLWDSYPSVSPVPSLCCYDKGWNRKKK